MLLVIVLESNIVVSVVNEVDASVDGTVEESIEEVVVDNISIDESPVTLACEDAVTVVQYSIFVLALVIVDVSVVLVVVTSGGICDGVPDDVVHTSVVVFVVLSIDSVNIVVDVNFVFSVLSVIVEMVVESVVLPPSPPSSLTDVDCVVDLSKFGVVNFIDEVSEYVDGVSN